MVETLLENVRDQIAESGKHIDHAKGILKDARADLARKSKQAVKVSRNAAEDLVDNAEHQVKKYPKASVAGGVLAGFFLGLCVGCLLSGRDKP